MELQEIFDATEAEHGGDCMLSITGKKQLRFSLSTKPPDLQRVAPHIVYSSPLQRALRTAFVAYGDRPIVVDPRLREIDTHNGMPSTELCAFIAHAAPQRTAKVNTTKVPDTAWWGKEDEKKTHARVQGVLRDIYKQTSKGKNVALVAHAGILKAMIGTLKPFPKTWGTPRGFPKNFKPYYGAIEGATPELLKVVPATSETASVVLLRHAHSRAQAAITLTRGIAELFRNNAVACNADSAKISGRGITRNAKLG